MSRIVIGFIILLMINCKPKGDLNPEGRQTVYPNYVFMTGNSGQPVVLNWVIGKSKACGWECWGDTTTFNYYKPDYYDIYLSTENENLLKKSLTLKGDLSEINLNLPDNKTYYVQIKAIYRNPKLELSSNIIIISSNQIRQSEPFLFSEQLYILEKDGKQYTDESNKPLFNKARNKILLTGNTKSGEWANWIQDVKTGEQVFMWETQKPIYGKISPDEKKALLVVPETSPTGTDSHNLHLFDIATKRFITLTNWKKTISNAIWSPTSDFCSIVYYDTSTGEIALATINVLTSKINVLRQENLNRFNSISLLDWLESDSQIYFNEIRNFPESYAKMTLFSIDNEGNNLIKVTEFENTTHWYEYSHKYNPVAQKLVFTSRRSGKTGMWVNDIKQKRVYQIVNSLSESYSILGWKDNNELIYQTIDNVGKVGYHSLLIP